MQWVLAVMVLPAIGYLGRRFIEQSRSISAVDLHTKGLELLRQMRNSGTIYAAQGGANTQERAAPNG